MRLIDEAVYKGYLEEAFQMLTHMLSFEYPVVEQVDFNLLFVNGYLITIARDHYILARMSGDYIVAVVQCYKYDDVQYWLKGAMLYA